MTLSLSLTNALSGLTAASRSLEVISANVANANNESYARREIKVSAATLNGVGAGVQVDGVERQVNQQVISDRRSADASLADANTRADTLRRIEETIGVPTEPGSLAERFARFESSLIEANSRPDSTARLSAVVTSATELVDHIKSISVEIRDLRMDADAEIGSSIEFLNRSLEQVENLNTQIFQLGNGGRDTTALEDQRQSVIDSISELVPVQEVPRDGGKVALFTYGGAVLLEDRAAEIGFTPTGFFTADMTLASGALSGLTLMGTPIPTTGSFEPLGGGKIGALFDIRDTLMPGVQEGLDALARDLIERFEDPSVDTSRAGTGPGLFTDGGSPLDPLDEIGLAGRLALISTVDPSRGGEVWRVRDGVAALAEGPPGDASMITRMTDAIVAPRAPSSGPFAGLERSLSGHSADFLSQISGDLLSLDRSAAYEGARREALKSEELLDGVDTDRELQKLLLVENAYAANARVIQSIEEVLDTLMRM